eukprot:162087_1
MSNQTIISVIWSYSCNMERDKINRALCRLETKFATGYTGPVFEELEAKFINDLQNSSWCNVIGNYALSEIDSRISQFILYVLFERITEIYHTSTNNIAIDQTTRNLCLKVFAEIMDHECIQIPFNEMLKWKTNLTDWNKYLRLEEQSNVSLIISKLIGSLPTKYTFDILNKTIIHHGCSLAWVPIF